MTANQSLAGESSKQPAKHQTATATAIGCDFGQHDPHRVPPDIRINGVNIEQNQGALVVNTAQVLTIEYYPRDLTQTLTLHSELGSLVQVDENRTEYRLPTHRLPRRHDLRLCTAKFVSRITLWRGEKNPYQTNYPNPQQAPQPQAYQIPSGLIRVDTAKEAEAPVSAHFTLGQFLPAPQDGAAPWPRYGLFSLALLEKLELVVQILREQGRPVSSLRILSAYRSPAHNAAVGGSRYSRHLYGDAVDFIVDQNDDGTMDDLNRDGVVDRKDLQWLTDRLARQSVPVAAGGEGEYESSGRAQAFLHLDARGTTFHWKQ